MTQYNGHNGSKTENRIGKKRDEKIFKISYTTRQRLENYMRAEDLKELKKTEKYLTEESKQKEKELIKSQYKYDNLDELLNKLLGNLEIEEVD